MMKIKNILLLSVFLLLLTRCEWKKEVIEDLPIITNVSFSRDVLPIFDASCNTTGCHATGGQVPDLSAAFGYTSLVDGGYVDTTLTVDQSELYQRMIDRQKPMPPLGNLSQSQINVIKSWIEAKAPNN